MADVQVRLALAKEIAARLGVSINQVGVWHTRRDRNGFPDPVAIIGVPVERWQWRKRTGRAWDLDAVLAWHESYVPDKGGRRPKHD